MTNPQPRIAPASPATIAAVAGTATAFPILWGLSLSHMINDTLQSLIAASYPIIKADFHLDYGQIGLLTFVFQGTAALLQPLVGLTTDRRPMPFSLPIGMTSSMAGLVVLALSGSYLMALLGAGLVGLGSAIFHPESSRVARLASGGRFGLAQSIFQVGGNMGTSIGPLLAAFIVVPYGRSAILWFAALALAGMTILTLISRWYRDHLRRRAAAPRAANDNAYPPRTIAWTVTILIALMASKYVYLAGLQSYYTFYAIETFGVGVKSAQILLFIHLFGVALGTLIGGHIGDRIGRKQVIWLSILGILPFTLALPHVGLELTAILTFVIGFLLASAGPAILVYAQELMPGRVGLIAGLFFGLAFGMGATGAAVLGELIDINGLRTVFIWISFLPALGLLAILLPDLKMRGT